MRGRKAEVVKGLEQYDFDILELMRTKYGIDPSLKTLYNTLFVPPEMKLLVL